MNRILIAMCGCAFLVSSVYPEERSDDRVIGDISFPKGNLLTWIAHFNGSTQPDGVDDEILFAPVLPKIETPLDMTNDLVLAKWIADVQVMLGKSLCWAEPTWSVLGIHDGFKVKFIKVREILNLFEEIYGCRIVIKQKYALVYPFPERLTPLCYSSRKGKKRSGLSLIVGLYTAYKPNHIFIHEEVTTGKVYVIASSKIHDEVLASINAQGNTDSEFKIEGLIGNKHLRSERTGNM